MAVGLVPASFIAVAIPINTALLIHPVAAVTAIPADSDANPARANFNADLGRVDANFLNVQKIG